MESLCCEICGKIMEGKSHKKTCSFNCRRTKWRRNLKVEVDNLKTSEGCAKCGYNAHPAALDFNHLDPNTKSFNIGEAFGNNYGKKKIFEEIAKCEILCANCHRVHTYENHVSRLAKS